MGNTGIKVILHGPSEKKSYINFHEVTLRPIFEAVHDARLTHDGYNLIISLKLFTYV